METITGLLLTIPTMTFGILLFGILYYIMFPKKDKELEFLLNEIDNDVNV